jgi:hypothetical protein
VLSHAASLPELSIKSIRAQVVVVIVIVIVEKQERKQAETGNARDRKQATEPRRNLFHDRSHDGHFSNRRRSFAENRKHAARTRSGLGGGRGRSGGSTGCSGASGTDGSA